MTKSFPAVIHQNQNGAWFFVSWNEGMTRGHSSKRTWATKAYAAMVARKSGHTVVA